MRVPTFAVFPALACVSFARLALGYELETHSLISKQSFDASIFGGSSTYFLFGIDTVSEHFEIARAVGPDNDGSAEG